jgi:pantoate--beta-alanine ligase
MRALDSFAALREAGAALDHPVGFVPTMGALHAGHLALVAAARQACRSVVASVFVNPMQFGAGEDLDRYPRDLEGDRRRLAHAGVDVLFAPDTATMYPQSFSTIVDVGDIGSTYEGAIRPTHFRGVATVLTKLLHGVEPDVIYAGQKDAQQTAVMRKLVRDLNFDVRVAVVPTVREPDGLALSSRNAYLTPEQRAAAPSLHRALETMLTELQKGAPAIAARNRAEPVLDPAARWEYLDVVDMETFAPLEKLRVPAFVIGAARFGVTRLIDNVAAGALP